MPDNIDLVRLIAMADNGELITIFDAAVRAAMCPLSPHDAEETVSLHREIADALELLSADDADQIIGPVPAAESDVLLRGVRAVNTMLYGALRVAGLGNPEQAFNADYSGRAVLHQILNIAYALGLKRGREEHPDV